MYEMETESLEQQLKVRKTPEGMSLSRAVRSESPSSCPVFHADILTAGQV